MVSLQHVLQKLKPVILPPFILASTIPYFLILCCWIVISFFLPVTYFHVVEDYLWGWYQKMVVFLLVHVVGIQFYTKGDIVPVSENALVISNHQCIYDWMITNVLALKQGMVGNMRYVIKDSVKYYPLYGFGFGCHGGVYVKRNGKYNNEHMKRVLNTLMQRKATIYFMVYPEGTRFNPERQDLVSRSQDFAAKMNLKPLHQVLTPRVKAFDCALDTLKDYVNAFYDITIIYGGPEGPKKGVRHEATHILQFITGKPCKHVFIDFKRIPIQDVLTFMSKHEASGNNNASASMLWLHQRFVIKDELLETFYQSDVAVDNLTAVQHTSSGDFVWKKLTIPLALTFPHALSFLLLHIIFLYFPLGRWLYVFSMTLGSLFGMIYGHFYF